MNGLRASWESHELNSIGLQVGDIVTLKTGQRGKVLSLHKHGEFTLLCGKDSPFSCFFPGDIARIDRRPPKRVRIYQADCDTEFIFQGFEWFKARGQAAPPSEPYRIVYDGQLGTDVLWEISYIFNEDHPLCYMGRSLSTSDIIELYDSKGSRFFYCDFKGYKKIPFKPAKYCFALISSSERDFFRPHFFKSHDEAFQTMRRELLSQLHSFEGHIAGSDYEIKNTYAWANYKVNSDWSIFRLKVSKDRKVSLSPSPLKKLVIWTYFSTPFSMGGKEQPTGCEVEVVEKLAFGHGYCGYRVAAPYGGAVICEENSGAIVGNSLDSVREDIRTGEDGMMREQVANACKERKKVKVIDPEEFWSIYQKSNPNI